MLNQHTILLYNIVLIVRCIDNSKRFEVQIKTDPTISIQSVQKLMKTKMKMREIINRL